MTGDTANLEQLASKDAELKKLMQLTDRLSEQAKGYENLLDGSKGTKP